LPEGEEKYRSNVFGKTEGDEKYKRNVVGKPEEMGLHEKRIL